MILVVSGPGGVGKGTVVERLLAADPRLWLSRSWTTRDRRPGESPDAYVFATRQAFEERVAAGGFIEWVEFLDYLQGSPVPEPPDGRDVVFEIDVHGARQIGDRYPGAVLVFIDAPSREDQEGRLRSRGDTEERIVQRIAKADEEVELARDLGSLVVINHDVEDCVADLLAIVSAARLADPSPGVS